VFPTGLARQGITRRRALFKWGLSVVLAAGLASGAVHAKKPDSGSALPVVALATLPKEAQSTHRLILQGGPFPHDKDGVVFGNRERLLPLQPRGHYREYTVRTPGAKNRGARRIVCGGKPPTQPDTCFYTSDHYASFSRIAP
jgi:ribonuclease T1